MTINIKNFLNNKSKMSKMGEFQNLKKIDGLEMSSVSAEHKSSLDTVLFTNHIHNRDGEVIRPFC